MNSIRKESSRVKILLVDDLKDNLLALEGLLRRDDVEIFKAQSGTEALEFMISHEFALVLIDVQMPGMNGFELAELMRGAKKTKNIPIIFVTGTALDQRFSFKGYESGAVDFLLKPLDTHMVRSKANIFVELYRQKKKLEDLAEVLKHSKNEMEKQVQERTAELFKANQDLQTEIIERKRVEKEILEIVQTEQRRFGSQLHDGLCQDLAGIMMVMKSLTQKMERKQPLDVADLKKISDLLHGAVSQARDTARGLYPGELEANSLMYMLEELTASRSLSGVSCRFYCPEPILISKNDIATHFYKIAQEGIANAVQHGKAQVVEVSFVRNNGNIVLTVKDEGMGFREDFQSSKGIGLKIMKNRAHIIGASFQVEPNVPQGVILTCSLKSTLVH